MSAMTGLKLKLSHRKCEGGLTYSSPRRMGNLHSSSSEEEEGGLTYSSPRRMGNSHSSSSEEEEEASPEPDYRASRHHHRRHHHRTMSEEEGVATPVSRKPRRRVYTNIGKLRATVVKGNIVEETADVIVNSAVKELRLDKGRASKSLLEAAGQTIQSECDNDYPNGIAHGDIAVTSGGNLSCQKIYHVCLPTWTGASEEKVLEMVVKKCLEKAHLSNKTSIAFPALGTGFLGYCPDTVAEVMLQCIQNFDKAHSSSTLSTISIVVFYRDTDTFRKFLAVARSLAHNLTSTTGASSATPSTKSPVTSKIGPIQFEVVLGKMAEQTVDVMVNSTSPSLQLGKGSILGRSLLAVAGAGLQTECDNNYPNGICLSDLAVTGAYNLPCKQVFHGTFLSFYSKQTRNKRPEEVLYDFVQECLKEMDSQGYTSVAFPALGTGYLKYPKDTVASNMVGAVRAYVHNNRTCVCKVKVIVYGNDATDIEQAFIDELQQKPQAQKVPTEVTPSIPARNTKAYFRYKYMENPHPPSYWTVFTDKKSIKSWTMAPKSAPSLVPVDQQTYSSIERAFKNTGMASHTVVSITRLESIKLLENYSMQCQLLFRQAYVSGTFKALQNVSGSSGPAVNTKHLDVSMTQHLHPEINELYLFHGTKSPYVNSISHQGLDNRLSAVGRVGSGVYAAEIASKSNQYTDKDGSGQSYMFLLRICLGDIYITNQAEKYKRPPCLECRASVCTKHAECFKSVVADGGSFSNREFVVYDQDQTYPEFLITYK